VLTHIPAQSPKIGRLYWKGENAMNRVAQTVVVLMFCFFFFVLLGVFTSAIAATGDQADNAWLNGKWQGRPPLGGDMTMTLNVDQNEIHGSAIIPGKGKSPQPDVKGSIKGKRVLIETFFPNRYPQGAVHYNCTRADENLDCKTKSGFATTFKKVD
jgi:hypothetical protein